MGKLRALLEASTIIRSLPLTYKIILSYFFLELNDAKKQIEALQLLVALLPVPNRDTLKALLSCLAKVASFSQDTVDSEGNMVRFI